MWSVLLLFRWGCINEQMADVPSHVYQYSFAGNPNWSKFYSGGAEIQQYLKDIAWRYDVEKYVRLNHLFQKADWEEEAQKWVVSVKDLSSNTVSLRDLTSKIVFQVALLANISAI